MDWLEQELKNALERKEPSAGFADRVSRLAARGAAPAPVQMPVRQRPRWWAAAAAAAVLLTAGGLGYRQYRGEMAKEQVMQAMRIASSKVSQIQSHVREAGR